MGSRHRRARGASYVEILVIVSVVLVLGLLALKLIGTGADDKAERQASCLQSFSCTGGNGGSGPVPIPGAGGPGAEPPSGGGGGGGFFSSIGNGISSAWNWVQTSQNPVVAFVRGAGSEVGGQIGSIGFIVMHPIKAVQGVGFAIMHPIATLKAMGEEWTDRSLAENLGHATVMVVEALTGTLEAKGGTLAGGAAETAADLAKAGSVAEKAKIIGEIAKDVVKDIAKDQIKDKPIELPQTGYEAREKAEKEKAGGGHEP